MTNREATTTLVLSELGPAQLPTTPTNPRKTIVVASIAFGLIAAVFAALAAASLRRRFVTADEIRDRMGLTVLGEVPTLVHPGAGPAEIFESTDDQRAPRSVPAAAQLPPSHVPGRDSHHRSDLLGGP